MMFDGPSTPDRFRVWLSQFRDLLDASISDLANLEVKRSPRMPKERVELAQRWRAERRDRAKVFGDLSGLFADPAWDILLDLYVHRDVKLITVSSACVAANVAPTTGLRHLRTLEDRGLVLRTDNPHDQRSHFVTLTKDGVELMDNVLDNSLIRKEA